MVLIMVSKEEKKKVHGEEEDYTWPKNEPSHSGSLKNNRTAIGLLLLVGECFIPETALKQVKKLFKRQKQKHVRYS